MSLSDLAALGSFVSAFAVVASLIYLGLQVHQNSKHTRALIQQGRVAGIASEYLGMADRELVSAHIVGNGGIATPEEIQRRQFWLECIAMLVRWTDTYYQHEAGLIGDEQFAFARDHMAGVLKGPGVRAHFQRSISTGANSKFKGDLAQLLAQSNAPDNATVD